MDATALEFFRRELQCYKWHARTLKEALQMAENVKMGLARMANEYKQTAYRLINGK